MSSNLRRFYFLIGLTVLCTQALQAGYLKDSSGYIVHNGFDECWHTGFWQTEDAVVGCDGVEKEEQKPVKLTRSETLDRVVLDAETYFGFDKATLKPGAVDKLDALLGSIRNSRGVERIDITGHADRIGSEAYNKALSQRRAKAVESYLRDRIGNAALIEAVGMGESSPAVYCPDMTGRQLIECLAPNRRVDIDAQVKVPVH